MREVWKFKIGDVIMPDGAKVLRVGMQNGAPCMWAEVETEHGTSRRSFVVVGTGHELPKGAQYVGGFSEPPFEWHVYEVFE